MSVSINGTTGLSLGAGSITFADSTTQSTAASGFGFKNRIINGAMMIDQRNAGASGTAINVYTLDRWGYAASQASKGTWGQNLNSVTLPAGFTKYLGFQSSSAYSVGSGDYFALYHTIEGLNVADFGWGTSNAKTVTLSFQVYSSLTGTFGGVLNNSGATRSYPFSYTVSSPNAWTTISVTIPGDTSGTWLTTNGLGIQILFGLGVGSTYSGTAGSWASANYVSATGATSVVGTNGATFYITGVQLEKGSTATSFDYRPYGTELQLCSRYYWKQYNAGSLAFYNRVYWNSAGNNMFFNIPAPGGMRTNSATVTCSPTTNTTSPSFTYSQQGNILGYGATVSGDNYMYAENISINAEL